MFSLRSDATPPAVNQPVDNSLRRQVFSSTINGIAFADCTKIELHAESIEMNGSARPVKIKVLAAGQCKRSLNLVGCWNAILSTTTTPKKDKCTGRRIESSVCGVANLLGLVQQSVQIRFNFNRRFGCRTVDLRQGQWIIGSGAVKVKIEYQRQMIRSIANHATPTDMRLFDLDGSSHKRLVQ